jgi:FKBP-type peptidyl-prolyl cis-trans isomerase
MRWLGPNRTTIAAGSTILALAIGIALIQCDRSNESVDASRSSASVPNAASGARGGEHFEQPALASGLIVEDLIIGDGKECKNSLETVTIHYRGMLEDGYEFDSSYARAQPIVAPLNGLIQGWQQGVPGMKIGGKRRLTIPSELAYSGMAAVQSGKSMVRDAGGAILIPPGATLIFEIELLDVTPAEQAPQH